MNPTSFMAAMAEHGLIPPAPIEPGRFHRFPGTDKRPGNKSGWCRLFPDGRGGVFGDWSTGLQRTWQDAQAQAIDRGEWLRLIREAEAKARKARVEDQRKAASRAVYLWNQALPAFDHPYLRAKGIKAHGARVDRHGNLLIPVGDGGGITSLQFIRPDGSKQFLSGGKMRGCWHRIGETTEVLLICEGFATGATLHQESGHGVIVAFNAGNLPEVAQAIRDRHQGEILICGDNDQATPGNPGPTAAIKAARLIGARWTVPDFTGLNPGPKDSDFNDLARLLAAREAA